MHLATGLKPSQVQLREFAPLLAMAAVLAIAWFAYRPALSGTFLLDDIPNLSGLASIDDAGSALQFVLGGTAGHLGRPLALASFVPQADAWDSNAEPFIRINILIHLLNGMLVLAFAGQIARVTLENKRDLPWLALSVSALWLFMPLLASSSLLIVQRMTTLSATFVLAGLLAYMIARRQLDARPAASLTAMTLSLVAATLLAAFSKENGALLPVFVLVLEATILSPPQRLPARQWNAWRSVFLIAPALIFLVFLFAQLPYNEQVTAKRDYTGAERLLNESKILWEYLINAFLPRGSQLGPFHEWRQSAGLFYDPTTIIAVIAWLGVVVAALIWRRTYRVAALAALWYLAGHSLESSTIPLELYFEHRNYVPIIGPIYALCYTVFVVGGRYRVISRVALAAYTSICAGVLFSTTSMWGRPLLAASYWYNHNPSSVRAATTLSSQQLIEMGPHVTIETLRDFANRNPEHAYIRIPELNLSCKIAPDEDHSRIVEDLKTALPLITFSHAPGEMLDDLLTTALAGDCESVDADVVADLAAAVLKNPKYGGNTRYNQFHHMLMARIARAFGRNEATLAHLGRAMDLMPTDKLNMMTVTALVDGGRFDEAREFIEDATHRLPAQPLRRIASQKNLEELMLYVNEMEKLADEERGRDIGD
jgi:hypothetical protein